jgi:hypothetical protein
MRVALIAPARYWMPPVSPRTDQISERNVAALKDAGCIQLAFGIESGSQRMLDFYGKGTTPEKHRRAMQLANRVFRRVSRGLFIGTMLRWSPAEKRALLCDVLRWLRAQPGGFLRFMVRVCKGNYGDAAHLFRRRLFPD